MFYTSDAIRIEFVIDVIHCAISSCFFIKCNVHTLKCLSIGTPKTINCPFVSNGKLMFVRCLNIQAHYNEAVIYLNFGTPKNNEFSIFIILGVPILKHIMVCIEMCIIPHTCIFVCFNLFSYNSISPSCT